MRILVVNWQDRLNPRSGGAELHLHEIFGRIAQRGHEVDLLCSGFDGAPSRAVLDGIDIYRTGTRYTYPFLANHYYHSNLLSRGYDVIIEDINKVPLCIPLWRSRSRVVALVHHLFGTSAFHEIAAPLAAMLWLSERPLGMFYKNIPFQAVSQSTADDLVQRGIPRESIRVIYNGVDSVSLTPNSRDRAATPLFVYLGRIKKYKRVDIVMRAFAELNHPTARLEIAGTGDYREALEAMARSLGIEDKVRFLGFVPEMEKAGILRRAWATLLASPKEGWGISNLESAACGTPVIATNSPGVRESVVDGETGFLVPQADVKSMAAAMRRLVESPQLVNSLGENARKFAERFTWERSADATLQHLEEVIAA